MLIFNEVDLSLSQFVEQLCVWVEVIFFLFVVSFLEVDVRVLLVGVMI